MTTTTIICDICRKPQEHRDNYGPMDLKTFCYSQNPFGELNGCFQNSRLQYADVCSVCSTAISSVIVQTIQKLKTP